MILFPLTRLSINMFLSLNHFLNPKLVKGWDSDIWLQRQRFLLQGWEDVWGDGSQHVSTELCQTDRDLRFTLGAVKLWLPRAHPWKFWLSRFGLGFGDLCLKLPKPFLCMVGCRGALRVKGTGVVGRKSIYAHYCLKGIHNPSRSIPPIQWSVQGFLQEHRTKPESFLWMLLDLEWT